MSRAVCVVCTIIMDEVGNMKQLLAALRAHRYEEADVHFKKLQQTTMRTWYVQHFGEAIQALRTLYKETQAQQVLHIAEQVGEVAVTAFPQHSFVASQYGWVLYDRYMKAHDVSVAQKERIAQRIMHMTTQNTYSPFEATVWRLLPIYEETSIEKAYALLQTLHRKTLSRDELRTSRNGEIIVHPSSREKYYRKWIDYTWQLHDARACYKACYEFMYTSGVTVRQPLPIYDKMIQTLLQQGRREEATAFATTLAKQHAYVSLLRHM